MDTRLVAGLLGAAVGVLYASIGASVAHAARGRPLMRGFVAFWWGVGGYALAEAAWVLLAEAGVAPFWLGLVILQLKIATLLAGFGGLISYLVGIYTGSRAASWTAGLAYAPMWIFAQAVYAMRQPIGQHATDWGLRLDYANASVEPWWTIMLVALILPPLAATVAYAGLARHASDARQKRRILAASASVFLLLLPNLLAWRAGNWPAWGLVEKMLGIAAALGMLATVASARRERREDDARPGSARRSHLLAERERLRQRIVDLI